jgi:hypothetical protein
MIQAFANTLGGSPGYVEERRGGHGARGGDQERSGRSRRLISSFSKSKDGDQQDEDGHHPHKARASMNPSCL